MTPSSASPPSAVTAVPRSVHAIARLQGSSDISGNRIDSINYFSHPSAFRNYTRKSFRDACGSSYQAPFHYNLRPIQPRLNSFPIWSCSPARPTEALMIHDQHHLVPLILLCQSHPQSETNRYSLLISRFYLSSKGILSLDTLHDTSLMTVHDLSVALAINYCTHVAHAETAFAQRHQNTS